MTILPLSIHLCKARFLTGAYNKLSAKKFGPYGIPHKINDKTSIINVADLTITTLQRRLELYKKRQGRLFLKRITTDAETLVILLIVLCHFEF